MIGCVLRELGFPTDEVLGFLDKLHKARGKPGWPESPWQRWPIETWKTDA